MFSQQLQQFQILSVDQTPPSQYCQSHPGADWGIVHTLAALGQSPGVLCSEFLLKKEDVLKNTH